jgi:hypothetical protein
MPTPFLRFTQDPFDDIINRPGDYHNFRGAAVRVRCYWTKDILSNFTFMTNSLVLIRAARSILQKYTLDLDVFPHGAPVTAHKAIRAGMLKNLSQAVGPKIVQAARDLPETVRSVAAEIADEVADVTIDAVFMERQGALDVSGPVYVSINGKLSTTNAEDLRKALEPVKEDNRLIVVFAPIEGYASGITVTDSRWFPWIVADPRKLTTPTMLLHEIGHACRLGHQQIDSSFGDATNVMYDVEVPGASRFWGWQVDTIYDSYWCTGRKPSNWWVKMLQRHNPFLWDEPN